MDGGLVGGLVANWVATAIIGIGMIYTIARNSKKSSINEATKTSEFENKIENIENQINHKDYGLSAIKHSVDAQALNCARTSSDYFARLKAAEADIKDLKRRK